MAPSSVVLSTSRLWALMVAEVQREFGPTRVGLEEAMIFLHFSPLGMVVSAPSVDTCSGGGGDAARGSIGDGGH
ncbi:unnamed protein product [Linum trigynum]|uniref:Uncharacterized protein n=1 Tax=Linum trigynum TaxID=586398 RepID=A0AAV2CKJ0_9ROSI